MSTVRREVVVARPRAAVFDYLADVSRHHEWERDLVRTEMVDDGPIGVGSRGVEVRRVMGREMRSPFVITRHEPPERQDFHTTAGPVRPDGVLRCEEDGAGTRVSYELTVGGLLGPVMARVIGRGMDRDLATLKRLLEEGG
ncbi:SRPBCC family protein [Geodermatophilus sp. SYSU D00815]